VGIGPFARTIALGPHTAGMLGKLYAETMEEVPMRPIEGLRSLGARPLQVLFWAIWPQARPIVEQLHGAALRDEPASFHNFGARWGWRPWTGD